MIFSKFSNPRDKSVKAIFDYHQHASQRASERIKKVKPTIQQHTIPNFILSQIGMDGPPYEKTKGILLQEHTIDFMQARDPKIIWEHPKGLVSPNVFSRINDIYTSASLSEPYHLEVFFSIVEGDAAKLIRSRLNDDYWKISNPYSFENNDRNLQTESQQRACLATFMAMQILRSKHKADRIKSVVKKYFNVELDFGASINTLLINTSLEVYEKQWIWVRKKEQDLFISELGSASIGNCHKRVGHMMVLSRYDLLYIKEKPDGFYYNYDKVVLSNSEVFFDWINFSIINNSVSYFKDGEKTRFTFVSHKNAKFEEKFKNIDGSGCCFMHLTDKFSNIKNTETVIMFNGYVS